TAALPAGPTLTSRCAAARRVFLSLDCRAWIQRLSGRSMKMGSVGSWAVARLETARFRAMAAARHAIRSLFTMPSRRSALDAGITRERTIAALSIRCCPARDEGWNGTGPFVGHEPEQKNDPIVCVGCAMGKRICWFAAERKTFWSAAYQR